MEALTEGAPRLARSKLASLLIAISLAAAAFTPASAGAWKWVFQDFSLSSTGGASSFRAVAKKCSGGKLGYYDFVNRGATVTSPGFEIHTEALAEMPVFAKFRQMRNVSFTVETAGSSLPPDFIAAMVNAFSEFYENMFVRYVPKKDRLTFRHQGIVLFGQQVLQPGEHTEPFKPKNAC